MLGAGLKKPKKNKSKSKKWTIPLEKFCTETDLSALENFLRFHRIVNIINANDFMMFFLGANLGLRGSEVCTLKHSDINWRQGAIKIIGKGSKIRYLPLTITTGREIKEHSNLQQKFNIRKYWIIGRSWGKVSRHSVIRAFNRWKKKLGLNQNLTFHSLRHSFASLLYQKTKDIRLVQKLLGHEKIYTTQIYTNIGMHEISCTLDEFQKSLSEKNQADVY